MKALMNAVLALLVGICLWACQEQPTEASRNGRNGQDVSVLELAARTPFVGGKFLAQSSGSIYLVGEKSVSKFEAKFSENISQISPVHFADHGVAAPLGADCFRDTLVVHGSSTANFFDGKTGARLPFISQNEITHLMQTERGVFTAGQPALSRWSSLAFRSDIPIRGKPRTLQFLFFRDNIFKIDSAAVVSADSVYILGKDFTLRHAVHVSGGIRTGFMTRDYVPVIFTEAAGVFRLVFSARKIVPVEIAKNSPRVFAPDVNGRGYIYPDGKKLYRQLLDGSPAQEVFDLKKEAIALMWTRGGEYLVVLTSDEMVLLWEPKDLPKR